LLCGDAVEAEELVQAALVRVALRWPFVRDKDNPDGYVKRAIVRGQINGWRRPSPALGEVPEIAVPDRTSSGADQEPVRGAVALVAQRQRAVLVRRYHDNRTAAETASLLGCSVGTVKSQTHKALAKLREIVEPDEVLS